MPQDSSGTSSSMSTAGLHPPSSTGTRNVVHVALVFDGVAFTPANLLNALTTQYGAGKVVSDKDQSARGTYVFRITP